MFWIGVSVLAGLVSLAAAIYVAIFVALAMDRGQTAQTPATFVDDIDWDAVDQQAAETIQAQPSIVAATFGKARHR